MFQAKTQIVDKTQTKFQLLLVKQHQCEKLGKQPKNTSDVSENSYSYRLVELSSLLKAFQPLHQCEVGGELTMSEDEALMYGNSSVSAVA